jgi:protein TonB
VAGSVAASVATPSPSPNAAAEKEITEEELKQMLVGKPLYLRGGYLGDSLSFTEKGEPVGHPTPGSYTLSAVQIDKVHLTKHKVELEGARYGLHFLGALPYEDPSKAVDRVKITPKKKVLKITIDREQVIKPKKVKEPSEKEKEKDKGKAKAAAPSAAPVTTASSETDVPQTLAPAPAQPTPAPTAEAAATSSPATQPPATQQPGVPTEDQAADAASVTTTTSPAHAAKLLREALDRVFATGLDDKLFAQMPEFWQLYYKAQAANVDYRPADPKVLRPAAVDTQAKVTSSIAPDSNEFAQASGIAGRALYRAVIGPDGHPGEIAVVRPIGFGLDENAVAAIRKASFTPAMKGGQPVAEALDLAVLFRIYSKRTAVTAGEAKPAEPVKPGPYTVRAPPPTP